MNEIKCYFKWFCRIVFSEVNRFLLKRIDIVTLKTIITKLYFGRTIDIKEPKQLSEKILWQEYHTDTTRKSFLSDKYAVRSYVAEKGFADTLVSLYGVWERNDSIDFNVLPDKFVLKATHGSDMNYLCTEKNRKTISKMKRRMHLWLNYNWGYISLESHYFNITPRIICEEYLDNEDGDIVDYKFFCINGKVKFIQVCTNRSKEKYLNVYDVNWQPIHIIVGAKENPSELSAPFNLKQMIIMAESLSQEIDFVRVDLYEVNDRVYFGEMTFTPAAGVLFHFSEDFLLQQGMLYEFVEGNEKK